MTGVLQRLFPREEGFYHLFVKQADNIFVGAKALLEMLSHYTGVPEQVQSIKAIEHHGDDITHAILTKLNQTFITPFDREDIHQLASKLDDVLDFVNAAGSRTVMYRIANPPPAAGELAKIILRQSQELQKAVSLMQKNGDILGHCGEITRLKNEADR